MVWGRSGVRWVQQDAVIPEESVEGFCSHVEPCLSLTLLNYFWYINWLVAVIQLALVDKFIVPDIQLGLP